MNVDFIFQKSHKYKIYEINSQQRPIQAVASTGAGAGATVAPAEWFFAK